MATPSIRSLLAVLCMALMAGCEEQMPITIEIGQTYELPIPPAEALHKLNAAEVGAKWGNPPLSLDHERANHFDKYQGIRLYFRHGGESVVYDTIKVVDEKGKPVPGDPYDLEARRVTILDTHYLNPDGFFRFQMPKPLDSLRCHEVFAILKLTASKTGSRLYLDRIRIGGCTADATWFGGLSPEEKVLQDFEAIVLKPLEAKPLSND